MNAMMTLGWNNRHKKIFIWYDFKQIRDAVLLLFFSEKQTILKRFLYANNGRWETDVLRYYSTMRHRGPYAKSCNIFLSIVNRPHRSWV